MMHIDPSTSLMDLGKDFSKARRLFRRLGLEIDSIQHLSVSQACDQVGISVKDFTRTLLAMSPGMNAKPSMEEWAEAPLADLINYIQDRHHTYTRKELIRLGGLLEAAVKASSARHPELLQIRFHFDNLREDLLNHLDAEERVIFPAILDKDADDAKPPLETLDDLHRLALHEHEAAEELFQNIAIVTGNFRLPLDAGPEERSLYLGLRDLEEDLFIHIYLENHLLFPRSLQETGQEQIRS